MNLFGFNESDPPFLSQPLLKKTQTLKTMKEEINFFNHKLFQYISPNEERHQASLR